ncbi:MAG: hypothetical protein IJT41_02700 [Clostridia bacterium]|nr:hypothetical protein [Clostridia bacterium]
MKMKKIAACCMAACMVFLTVFCVHAEETPYEIENGYQYRIEHTPDGDVLRDVKWYWWYSTINGYVPKTLGGIALTPDVLNGAVFNGAGTDPWISSFTVDDDNPWFTIRNGALYTKDGKTAVAFPSLSSMIYVIADGTQTIGSDSIYAPYHSCIVFPDSVTTIADDAICLTHSALNYNFQIAGSTGSAAESYAAKMQYAFLPMGETHTHVYYYVEQEPTCSNSGYKAAQCPCGDVYATEVVPPDPDAHLWMSDPEDSDGPWLCAFCGVEWSYTYDEPPQTDAVCNCLCHKSNHSPIRILFELNSDTFHSFVYCFVLFFWRLTGTHQYCACGERHY